MLDFQKIEDVRGPLFSGRLIISRELENAPTSAGPTPLGNPLPLGIISALETASSAQPSLSGSNLSHTAIAVATSQEAVAHLRVEGVGSGLSEGVPVSKTRSLATSVKNIVANLGVVASVLDELSKVKGSSNTNSGLG